MISCLVGENNLIFSTKKVQDTENGKGVFVNLLTPRYTQTYSHSNRYTYTYLDYSTAITI